MFWSILEKDGFKRKKKIRLLSAIRYSTRVYRLNMEKLVNKKKKDVFD